MLSRLEGFKKPIPACHQHINNVLILESHTVKMWQIAALKENHACVYVKDFIHLAASQVPARVKLQLLEPKRTKVQYVIVASCAQV